ncbi:hypothetical protein B0H21DRAFT_114251 [Amylocystis lapponica]|nr:hypothetical protein B0H21DRAFT_114251 [Amylocystis lapponica]
MRLRNWKETVPPTIEETLMDVHPRSLDEPFHWGGIEWGLTVWVKTVEGKWCLGTVEFEGPTAYTERAIEQSFYVRYGRNKKSDLFRPYDGNIKPDTPEVRELLRKAGYFV